jgi:hypothetical protein
MNPSAAFEERYCVALAQPASIFAKFRAGEDVYRKEVQFARGYRTSKAL